MMKKHLALCLFLGVAAAMPFAAHAENVLTVNQGRPLLPDISTNPGSVVNPAIKVAGKSMRTGIILKTLASWGVITPKSEIMLSLSLPDYITLPENEQVRWQFDKSDYLPDDELRGNRIKINAWHPFKVTAKVNNVDGNVVTFSSFVNVGEVEDN